MIPIPACVGVFHVSHSCHGGDGRGGGVGDVGGDLTITIPP